MVENGRFPVGVARSRPDAPAVDPRPPSNRGPIHSIPTEILFEIFELLAPPRTRDGVYALLELTHVCHFWRVALLNKPQAWAAIFATQGDRRGFVEACLERSHAAPLEVTVDARSYGPAHQSCTCVKGEVLELIHNKADPCERHFVFESLVDPRHSGRIHTLNVVLDDGMFVSDEGLVSLELNNCRFFQLRHLQLTNLEWEDLGQQWDSFLPYSGFFPPTLRSLSFRGFYGHDKLTNVKNLTSLTFDNDAEKMNAEGFRTFMLNNQSLETLSLGCIKLEGGPDGPPVTLSKLKSFSIYYSEVYSEGTISAIFRVPALQRLSSLSAFMTTEEDNRVWLTLCATGEDIMFTLKCDPECIQEAWQDLVEYAEPIIQRVRLEHWEGDDFNSVWSIIWFAGAHTLEICRSLPCPSHGFWWRHMRQLGPQLKNIRFEMPLPEETGLFQDNDPRVEMLFQAIEDLVVDSFKQGRPFSSVERMAVGESEQVKRQQGLIWRRFYDGRHLDQYILHE